MEIDMRDAKELKQIFRKGWENPNVVAHRVERFLDGEFGFEPSRNAWENALRQAVSSHEIQQAVDLGTGPGTIAQFWAEFHYEVTALDFSQTMLDAGRQAAKSRQLTIEFIQADIENPPLAENSYDLVSSRSVLFTLPHPGYALAGWVKLLRPGGLLMLIGENNPTDPEKLKRQYRPAPGWQPDKEYLNAMAELPIATHTDRVARVIMEAAGLEQIRSISMSDVIDARQKHEEQNPSYGVLQGTPYILVGHRP